MADKTQKKKPTWEGMMRISWKKNVVVPSRDFGIIDFSPRSMKEVRGIGNMSYRKYLDAQKNALGKLRAFFQECYFNGVCTVFTGTISVKTEAKVCFSRIRAEYTDPGGEFHFGYEDHVWMPVAGFEQYKPEDFVRFSADIYRYCKSGDGLYIDYALENPSGISRVEKYHVPSISEEYLQSLFSLRCRACLYMEYCDGGDPVCLCDMCFNTELLTSCMRKYEPDERKRRENIRRLACTICHYADLCATHECVYGRCLLAVTACNEDDYKDDETGVIRKLLNMGGIEMVRMVEKDFEKPDEAWEADEMLFTTGWKLLMTPGERREELYRNLYQICLPEGEDINPDFFHTKAWMQLTGKFEDVYRKDFEKRTELLNTHA